MVGSDALAAGALPDPADDADRAAWAWRWNRPVFTSTVNDQSQAVRIVEDLRSKRRFVSEENDLVLLLETGGGASVLNVDGIIRSLFLERPAG